MGIPSLALKMAYRPAWLSNGSLSILAGALPTGEVVLLLLPLSLSFSIPMRIIRGPLLALRRHTHLTERPV